MLINRRQSGYTLIEVLVAMVILALSLTVLLRIFSTGLRNISVSEDYARAILIAEAQLESAGTGYVLAAGSTDGVAGQKYRWTQTIETYLPYPDSATIKVPLDAYTVTVDVEWPNADRMRRVSLSGIRLAEARRPER